MELTFSSIEEVKEFVKQLKGTRGGKDKDEADEAPKGSAPAPLMPPTGQSGFGNAGGFAPPAAGATPAAPGPFAAAAPQLAPEVAALVSRINTKLDEATKSGQATDVALSWFRSQCGAEAANATFDQIKTNFLPKLAVPQLTEIAKLMAV